MVSLWKAFVSLRPGFRHFPSDVTSSHFPRRNYSARVKASGRAAPLNFLSNYSRLQVVPAPRSPRPPKSSGNDAFLSFLPVPLAETLVNLQFRMRVGKVETNVGKFGASKHKVSAFKLSEVI